MTRPAWRPALTTCAAVVLMLAALGAAGVGRVLEAQQAGSEGAVPADLQAALMDEGQSIFGADCAACHGAEGSEGAAPALTGNVALTNKDQVIRQVLEGNPAKGMPPFGPALSDRQGAAVSTFIRNAWDNDYGVVLEADIKRVREEIARKK